MHSIAPAAVAILAIMSSAVITNAATIAAGHHGVMTSPSATAMTSTSPATAGDGRSHHGPSRPNVLYLLSDDLRADVHALSDSPTVTPNLDKLAARSLIFERAYCQPVS